MGNPRQWSLGYKLTLVAAPFLLLALVIIAVTLWVSWQLEGGAAAVNEAGRMRMQAYRLSLSIGTADTKALPQHVAAIAGPVGSAVIGGVGCIVVALLWIRFFPALWNRDKLI